MEKKQDTSLFVVSSFIVLFFVFLFVKPTGYAVGSLLGDKNNSLVIIGVIFIFLILALGTVYFVYKRISKKKVIANVPLPIKENKERDVLEGIAEHRAGIGGIDVDKLFSAGEKPIEKADNPVLAEKTAEKRVLTNLNELKNTIINLLRQRYSKQQILNLLESRGWTLEQIEKAIEEINLDNLKIYIGNSLKEGFSKEQIKQYLLKNGWSEEIITKLL